MQDQKGNIGVIVSFIIVAALIGLAIYSLMHRPVKENPLEGIGDNKTSNTINSEPSDTTKVEDKSASQNKNMEPNVRKLENFTPVSKVDKLEKIDLVPGTGEEVKPDATVSVQYTGAIASTGVIFQSSKDFGTDPVTFPLSGVIKGWTEGIPGMKIGGTRRLIIPSEMAYGSHPPAGSGIPVDADLVFDVELVAIK